MATNPFEDENGVYHVLINEEGQHSLWPSFVAVPEGWTIIHKSDTRAACLEFIEKNWTDMRPNSLIKAMNEMAQNQKAEGSQPVGTAQPETPGCRPTRSFCIKASLRDGAESAGLRYSAAMRCTLSRGVTPVTPCQRASISPIAAKRDCQSETSS